jgi:cholesterol oxidase
MWNSHCPAHLHVRGRAVTPMESIMPDRAYDFDFIVIGSGFGGSVAAHRLTEKGYRVAVMEMGRRWTPENLPTTNWLLWRWIWRPEIALRGFFNITPFRHVMLLHGCAVGGGSITYANTSLVPKDTIWECGSWAGLAPWKQEMPSHYETVVRMLGVAENHILGPADHVLKQAADAAGIGDTFYRTRVAVLEGPEGEPGGRPCPDPYFGGDGPDRATCTGCGGCMVGCRYNAKNTLDKNYLYLAEKHGAQVFAETRVVDVAPLDGKPDGSEGYRVCTVKSTAWVAKEPRKFTCRGVVFAASALGTMDLLFRLKDGGSLPAVSNHLGHRVRTNAESLIGVRVPHSPVDLSLGVAIGSGVYLDEHTHIEATRYPARSDAMGLLATVLAEGRPGWHRILSWLKTLAVSLVRRPFRTVRFLHPFGWARESIILLCMQSLDGHIEMRLGRPWFWPFRKILMSHGTRIPTYIPRANDFARKVAALVGGTPMSMISEILFDVPGTAHLLGGCPIADSPAQGVVDQRHHLFGYKNMYVCDGSVIAANLGVNPSLTICALTERAMSFIPPAHDSTAV